MLKTLLVMFWIWVSVEGVLNRTDCPNVRADVAALRRRRHVVFPDGSNVVLTISLVKAFMTHAPSGWNLALEIDVMFPLPDANFTLAKNRRKLHHRQKRKLWERLTDAMELHNINGHSCLLKSICEAKAHLLPSGVSLIHDILRAIFTVPSHETGFIEEMGANYNELQDPNFCSYVDDCPISLLSFITELNSIT